MSIDWKHYDPAPFFDELMEGPGQPRAAARAVADYLATLDDAELQGRKQAADNAILEMGISFTVYSEGENIDRAWPFDIIPRVIPRREWEQVAAGLEQRMTALNLLIDDIYNEQRIFRDGVIPRYVLEQSRNFREQCVGIHPPHGVWAHVCGSDLVRAGDGQFHVLEDNLRVPSGVSYMLENRQVTKRVFPELFQDSSILPVDEYPAQLFDMLASISPRPQDYPEIAVLTPGIYNSAYFEHSFLAQRMGAELVEGADLMVGDDDCVYMRTIDGPERVDVIYRRIDDAFLDPEVFNPDSMLGVPGLMRAWRKGNVGLANAPGAGVADDKVMYAFIPEVIRYYLDQDPIIPNVPTWLCSDDEHRQYVLDHLDELVVKPANESGGYGMLVGPHASKKQRSEFAKLIRRDPRNYIAQPTLDLSVAPTLCGAEIEPRHLDLRPFILQGVRTDVTAGGLTRVAMRKGSLVVNSSQGGGSKDTWIVDEED
ncbi:circularly permuted type 2 ATP-grasp protein [Thioalkalivibrio sp. ALE11]|uniref:circularly permuted type 2 ATP-grasp protein n=1 Tax=Thioalkalivibrio sp. ALE11 TaxID=1265494 RepID=UPI00037CA783|nr:circularly permuted type 2 ATP-grasp protein [Thioalkalivibrio sp. ALE11]